MNRNCHQRSSKSMCAMQVHKAGWLVICKHITLLATFSSKNEGLHPASWAQPRGHITAQSPTLQTIPSYIMLQTHKKKICKDCDSLRQKKNSKGRHSSQRSLNSLQSKSFGHCEGTLLTLRSHETLQETAGDHFSSFSTWPHRRQALHWWMKHRSPSSPELLAGTNFQNSTMAQQLTSKLVT